MTKTLTQVLQVTIPTYMKKEIYLLLHQPKLIQKKQTKHNQTDRNSPVEANLMEPTRLAAPVPAPRALGPPFGLGSVGRRGIAGSVGRSSCGAKAKAATAKAKTARSIVSFHQERHKKRFQKKKNETCGRLKTRHHHTKNETNQSKKEDGEERAIPHLRCCVGPPTDLKVQFLRATRWERRRFKPFQQRSNGATLLHPSSSTALPSPVPKEFLFRWRKGSFSKLGKFMNQVVEWN